MIWSTSGSWAQGCTFCLQTSLNQNNKNKSAGSRQSWRHQPQIFIDEGTFQSFIHVIFCHICRLPSSLCDHLQATNHGFLWVLTFNCKSTQLNKIYEGLVMAGMSGYITFVLCSHEDIMSVSNRAVTKFQDKCFSGGSRCNRCPDKDLRTMDRSIVVNKGK